jgi:hypothetical protein
VLLENKGSLDILLLRNVIRDWAAVVSDDGLRGGNADLQMAHDPVEGLESCSRDQKPREFHPQVGKAGRVGKIHEPRLFSDRDKSVSPVESLTLPIERRSTVGKRASKAISQMILMKAWMPIVSSLSAASRISFVIRAPSFSFWLCRLRQRRYLGQLQILLEQAAIQGEHKESQLTGI